ncbi:MAG: heparan N-sulfatase [Planctomycetaceae bacterium]|nr:heparan N-sulfatase [Planctomycetaceae bacterium]
MKLTLLQLVALASLLATVTDTFADEPRPNILFISVDDMSCDSVGVFGCKLPDTTPNIDRLAKQGLRFQYAHVCVGNCMPSRNVMFSGRYPHNNRVEGFYQVKDPDYPVLCDLMKAGGYFTAIRGKVSHSTPYQPYAWDLVLDTIDGERQHIKSIESYYNSTKRGIEASKKVDKPFCLLVNISDPHKPFYAIGKQGKIVDDPNKPSRVFTADEVPVPGFLPDHPDVRLELAHYYSSVRRADDCTGAILKALDESGMAKNTVVVFLSDHGMPLPFAKTAVWHHSTHTPWIVRWPGVTKANAIDKQHMISAIDLLPTLLDVAGLERADGLEGNSFLPLLRGEEQDGCDMIFKEYNENAGGGRHPMRSVQTKRFGYIFNPWSDGERVFKTATTGTMAYRRMKSLAVTDERVAARLNFFNHRVREELYDYEKDPDALHNLIDDPAYRDEADKLRDTMETWMVQTKDHMLEVFQQRDNEAVVQAYMTRIEAESAARRKRPKQRRSQPKPRRNANLIELVPPKVFRLGKPITVVVQYTLPNDSGEQLVHVTLKNGGNQRIERKVIKITGTGEAKATFELPAGTATDAVIIAAFVGEDFQHNLQYLNSKPIPLK